MNNRIKSNFQSLECLRVELDIVRDCLRKAENSFEIGEISKAEVMTIHAIIHLKNILRELEKSEGRCIRASKWIS